MLLCFFRQPCGFPLDAFGAQAQKLRDARVKAEAEAARAKAKEPDPVRRRFSKMSRTVNVRLLNAAGPACSVPRLPSSFLGRPKARIFWAGHPPS